PWRVRRRRRARRRGGGRAPRKAQSRSRRRQVTAARRISVRFRLRAKQPSRATFRALASARHGNPWKPFQLGTPFALLDRIPASTPRGWREFLIVVQNQRKEGRKARRESSHKGRRLEPRLGFYQSWRLETNISACKAYRLFVAYPKVLRPKTVNSPQRP